MNAKISVFFICVEVIIYLLLHNLHDCTFKALLDNRNFTMWSLQFQNDNLNAKIMHCLL